MSGTATLTIVEGPPSAQLLLDDAAGLSLALTVAAEPVPVRIDVGDEAGPPGPPGTASDPPVDLVILFENGLA